MKSRITILATALCGLLFVSCDHSRTDITVPEYPEEPIRSITVRAAAPISDLTVATKAGEAEETRLEKLALVLIPKADNGAIVINDISLPAPTQVSNTNYIYNATITFPEGDDQVYKGEYYLYAIGNPGKQYVAFNAADLQGKTKAEIDEWIITKANTEPDFAESSLLMTGIYGTSDGAVELVSFDNTLKDVIHLSRVVSKSTFTFVNGSSTEHGAVKFVPLSYSIYNYSLSSSLFERPNWKGATPDGIDFQGTASAFDSREDIPIDKAGVFSFYMPENVQTTYPATPDSWSYLKREVRRDQAENNFTSTSLHSEFAYAPKKATYIVVKGDYSDNDYTGTVEYTIHLGNFSDNAKNFSVRRNYRYNYRITINGVKNIVAEAQATSNDEDVLFQPGAEGNIIALAKDRLYNVDAHYEQVMLSFDQPAKNATYQIMVGTPYSGGLLIFDGNTAPAGVDASLYNWVKFVKPRSATEFKYYEKKSPAPNFTATGSSKTWATIYELIADMNAGNQKYYTKSGNKVYVAAYVDEFYYSGKALNTFVNVDPRTLLVSNSSVAVSLDKQSTFTNNVLFSFNQKSIRTDLNLNTLSNPFGFERVEETTPYCGDTSPSTGNAFNPKVTTGTDEYNGWSNFNSLFSSANWNTVVNVAKNGHFSNTDKGASMQNSYNYGWYQCMSRNRDEDGDGTIDGNEIKWYLPAVNQYLTIMFANHNYFDEFVTGLIDENPLYLTSTAGKVNKRTWFAAEGIAIGYFGTNWWNNWNIHIRCVRNLGTYNAAPSATHTYNSSTREFQITGYNPDVMRTTYMTGGYASHDLSNANLLKMPTKFVAAADYIKESNGRYARFSQLDVNGVVDVCAARYSEAGHPVGEWRVPNAKEFYLMTLQSGLVNGTYGTACRTISSYFNNGGKYSQGATMPIFYYSDIVSTDPNTNPFVGKDGTYIRCVRDVR